MPLGSWLDLGVWLGIDVWLIVAPTVGLNAAGGFDLLPKLPSLREVYDDGLRVKIGNSDLLSSTPDILV